MTAHERCEAAFAAGQAALRQHEDGVPGALDRAVACFCEAAQASGHDESTTLILRFAWDAIEEVERRQRSTRT